MKEILLFPDFNEAVTWIVAKDRIGIDLLTLEGLRTFKDKEGNPIAPNVRETQPLGTRFVYLIGNDKY